MGQDDRDPEDTEVWETRGLPGSAGSGLIGCVGASFVLMALGVAACLWLIGGPMATVVAALIGCAWIVFTVIAIWQIIEMRRADGYTRIPLPPQAQYFKLADAYPPDTFAAVTLWVVSTVLEITRAAYPAMSLAPGEPETLRWNTLTSPTAKEALAFALHAVERGAMELAGPEGRAVIIATVWPAAIRMTTDAFDLKDAVVTLNEIDAILAQYRSLEPFNPSVLEAAFQRLAATCYEGANDQDLERILTVMKEAVRSGALQDALLTSWAVRDIR